VYYPLLHRKGELNMKATEQQEKDFKEVVTVVIVVIALILILVYVWPLVFGQVEKKQSVTKNDNGQHTGINEVYNGTPKSCDSLVSMKLLGDTRTVTEEQGTVMIHYRKATCHTYGLADNWTVTEVK
jgi:hypothetical protein